MFPIRDDQPSFSKPFVNYFIIALNVLVYVLLSHPLTEGQRQHLADLLLAADIRSKRVARVRVAVG